MYRLNLQRWLGCILFCQIFTLQKLQTLIHAGNRKFVLNDVMTSASTLVNARTEVFPFPIITRTQNRLTIFKTMQNSEACAIQTIKKELTIHYNKSKQQSTEWSQFLHHYQNFNHCSHF